ncbi:MAG TPA: thioredoxin family protein [Bacillota bacterium]|nr:thioredoxin family protein [Bacillota bacterium]
MRKGLIGLGLVLMVLVLWACTPSDRLDLSAENTVDAPIVIDQEQLGAKIAAGDSFALLITSVWCSTCQDFSPLLNEIIVQRQIIVYEIVIEDGFAADNPLVPYQYTPTFVLWKNGEIWTKIDAVSQPKTFDSVRSFESFLKKWVLLS